MSNIRAFFKGIYESLPDIQIVMGPDGKPAGEVRVTFGFSSRGGESNYRVQPKGDRQSLYRASYGITAVTITFVVLP